MGWTTSSLDHTQSWCLSASSLIEPDPLGQGFPPEPAHPQRPDRVRHMASSQVLQEIGKTPPGACGWKEEKNFKWSGGFREMRSPLLGSSSFRAVGEAGGNGCKIPIAP
ncbi:predicted protein [Aspergillus terreus NIH2624]|uniref:Uncharacterized protein n=1 Tax=Aspergillus terreus (strain NIH 2624 / FGSC A1156) TaxID=341663 RepID=Q0C9X9_ASPTN|nr:uncharacterized protein ATEG_09505 [Aspergillus terreus NIH2624]EAU29696.1 predicted protein [Aspergillus terreus NIH2624]